MNMIDKIMEEGMFISNDLALNYFDESKDNKNININMEIYKRSEPTYRYFSSLLQQCKRVQTIKNLEFYKSLNPDNEDIKWFLKNCTFARENWNDINYELGWEAL